MRHILILAFISSFSFGYATQAQDSRTVEIRDETNVDKNSDANLARDQVYHKSWALLIGINKYDFLFTDNQRAHARAQLHFAKNDVTAMRKLLIKFGFDPDRIRQLTDEEATKTNIDLALADLTDTQKIQKNDRVLIYFSGHGESIKIDGSMPTGYLLPHDAKIPFADPKNPKYYNASCIKMTELRHTSTLIPAKHVLILVDACYSGLATVRPRSLRRQLPTRWLEKKARQIIVAGEHDQKTYEFEDLGHGVFTEVLVDAIMNHRAEYDDPPDYMITTSELEFYLSKVVPSHPIWGNMPEADVPKIPTPHGGDFTLDDGDFTFFYPRPPGDEQASKGVQRPKRKYIENFIRPVYPDPVEPPIPEDSPKTLAPPGMVLVPETNYQKPFFIDECEVTNAEYEKFLNAHPGYSEPKFGDDKNLNQPEQPVVGVSWDDAIAYAKWAGKTLPTEAQWTHAARGGIPNARYAWGNAEVDGTQCNFADKSAFRRIDIVDSEHDDGFADTAPVKSFKPNGYGIYNMSGNVWEWCRDELADGKRVFRGGSYLNLPQKLEVTSRYTIGTSYRGENVGFRCVKPYQQE